MKVFYVLVISAAIIGAIGLSILFAGGGQPGVGALLISGILFKLSFWWFIGYWVGRFLRGSLNKLESE